MHDEGGHAGPRAQVHQGEQACLRVLVVDADATLHGGGNGDRGADRGHALGHQLGLAHQAGAEPPALHPVGRATDIEVDLAVAVRLADPRGLG